MSEANYLTSRECWWLALGQLFGVLRVERNYDYQTVTPRLGLVGEFFMRKSGLRGAVGSSQHD